METTIVYRGYIGGFYVFVLKVRTKVGGSRLSVWRSYSFGFEGLRPGGYSDGPNGFVTFI